MVGARKTRGGRVLLLSPNMIGSKTGINRIQPGLGIGFLAAVLKQEGHEVFVRDTALEGYENKMETEHEKYISIGETDEQIESYIRYIKPDVVGISVTFSNMSANARNIAGIVKRVDAGIYVVIGGNHVTNTISDYCYAEKKGLSHSAFHEAFYREICDKNIDFAMFGESEYTFAELVDCLINAKPLDKVKNIVFRDENEKLHLKSYPLSRKDKRGSLEKLPYPARELFNMEKYFDLGAFQSPRSKARNILPLSITRGCPEKCTFCTTAETWGSKLRWRSRESILNEIHAAISLYGKIDEIQFSDDNLTADINNLLWLCDELEKLGIPWCTPNGTKANYNITRQPEYYKRMKEAGCYQITIACETGNQNVMDNCLNKSLKLHEMETAVKNAKNAGLFVHTYWIVGFYGETREEMESTIMFAASLAADGYSVSILTPLPGTPIYRQAVENDLFWPEIKGIEFSTLRSSLIKVDGFSGPGEFEQWVDTQNTRLNNLLGKRDPLRLARYEELRKAHLSKVNFRQT